MKRLVTVLVAGTIGIGAAFAQGPHHPGPGHDRERLSDEERIEMRINRMQECLNLSDEQAGELKELLISQNEKRQKAIADHRAEMQKMHEQNMADIEKLLTPEQISQWKEMKNHRDGHRPGPGDRPHHRHHPAPHQECCK